MTENVYVIKVKTKPPLSSLYPSERRYSASTVGGLSLVHFGLGALSLLLGALALSLQGPILSVACLVPFVTGLLAWRRWYIDRNIAVFFYASLFSLVVAVLCCVVTIFDIAAASGSTGASLWPLEKILDARRYSAHPLENPANGTRVDDAASPRDNPLNVTDDRDGFLKIDESSGSPITLIISGAELNESDLRDGAKSDDYDNLKAEASFALEERAMMSGEIARDKDGMSIVRESTNLMKEKAGSFLRGQYEDSPHARTLLTLNVLVASLLEVFWSLLSARIAFRGMTNRLPESNGAAADSKAARLQRRKPPAPKPDILDHDRRLSECLQSFASLQGLAGAAGPRLPLPESSREFRERVERFLANQVTHRAVEIP